MNKCLSISEYCRASASRLPILTFPSSERLVPFWTKLQVTNYQVWLLLEFLLVSHRTTKIPLEVSFFNKVNFVNPFQQSDKLRCAPTFQ